MQTDLNRVFKRVSSPAVCLTGSVLSCAPPLLPMVSMLAAYETIYLINSLLYWAHNTLQNKTIPWARSIKLEKFWALQIKDV